MLSALDEHTYVIKQWSFVVICLQAGGYSSLLEEAFLNIKLSCYDWPSGSYSEITYKHKLQKWYAGT